MGRKPTKEEDALRTIEALGVVHDDSVGPEPTAQAIARMRRAIDQSFERAWARVRANDRASAERTAATRRRPPSTWTREAALARIAELRALLGGQLVLAHRKLAEMTDDDMRTLVDDLESIAARHGKHG